MGRKEIMFLIDNFPEAILDQELNNTLDVMLIYKVRDGEIYEKMMAIMSTRFQRNFLEKSMASRKLLLHTPVCLN